MHEVDYGRASLAVDLCDEFRYLIDALVLAMINRGELNQNDFRQAEAFARVVTGEDAMYQPFLIR